MKSKKAAFRADLFYRLKVYPITVPPLRKHREDIELLVWHFLEEINSRVGKNIEKIPQSVMQSLTGMDYPGNVRELKNLLEHAVITSDKRHPAAARNQQLTTAPRRQTHRIPIRRSAWTMPSDCISPMSWIIPTAASKARTEPPRSSGSSPAPCAIVSRSWVSSATIDGFLLSPTRQKRINNCVALDPSSTRSNLTTLNYNIF